MSKNLTITTTTTVDDNSAKFLLPRSAWNSEITYLKVVFRAKQALDLIEAEHDFDPSLRC